MIDNQFKDLTDYKRRIYGFFNSPKYLETVAVSNQFMKAYKSHIKEIGNWSNKRVKGMVDRREVIDMVYQLDDMYKKQGFYWN